MKKMSWGLYGIGMALLLTSCVAKKKYTEAQNRISQLQQQNADCTARTESLNSNLSTLQQTNSDLQRRYDSSTNAYTTQQTRWSGYTGFYDKQKSTAEQMHQTLHQQLDGMIGASNIVMSNNKVYITLPESTLFTSGSTSLSSKGKQIVNTLASSISQNPDVEVYVATSATDVNSSTAMNYNGTSGSGSMNNGSYNNNNSSTTNGTYNNNSTTNGTTNGTYNNNSTNNGTTNGTYNNNSTTNRTTNGTYNNNSTTNGSTNGTYNNTSNSDTYTGGSGVGSNYNSGTRKHKSNYSSTSGKSYASNHPSKSSSKYKSESSHRTMRSNYASSSTKPSSNSMAVARASTIVSALRQGGVQKAGIQVTDPVNGTSSSPRKYQVIVSPSMEGYYDMMGKETGMK